MASKGKHVSSKSSKSVKTSKKVPAREKKDVELSKSIVFLLFTLIFLLVLSALAFFFISFDVVGDGEKGVEVVGMRDFGVAGVEVASFAVSNLESSDLPAPTIQNTDARTILYEYLHSEKECDLINQPSA